MGKVLIVVIALVALVYGVALSVPIEPEEQRPGMKLGGDLAADQIGDWSTYGGPKKIWVETNTWYGIPHSVTTISFAADGKFYVPCKDCDTKSWPRNVDSNPQVRLKIGDELYERTAVRVTDATDLARIRSHLSGLMKGGPTDDIAIFRMDPR